MSSERFVYGVPNAVGNQEGKTNQCWSKVDHINIEKNQICTYRMETNRHTEIAKAIGNLTRSSFQVNQFNLLTLFKNFLIIGFAFVAPLILLSF
ncbi:hypothetical protein M1N91_02890, partial [Dehalococcoidia bacterium]|nr:hypothetical protein [Dehalococcoidia bacterium]